MGRGRTAVAAGLLAAAVLYVAFSWLLTPLMPTGTVLGYVFGFWAIPTYAILALAVFGWRAAG